MVIRITSVLVLGLVFLSLVSCLPASQENTHTDMDSDADPTPTPALVLGPQPTPPQAPINPPVAVLPPIVAPPIPMPMPVIIPPVVPTPHLLLSVIEYAGSLRLESVSLYPQATDAVKMVKVDSALIFFTIGKVWRLDLNTLALRDITPTGYNDGYPVISGQPSGRSAKYAVVESEGDIALIYGGVLNYTASPGANPSTVNTGWIYRESTGAWFRIETAFAPRNALFHSALIQGKLIVWSPGNGGVYDIFAGSWRLMPDTGLQGSLRTAKVGNRFVAWTRQRVCFQSRENCPNQRVYESKVWIYNPFTDQWVLADDPPVSLTEYCEELTTPIVGGSNQLYAVCAGAPNYSAGNMPLVPATLDITTRSWTLGTRTDIAITGLGKPLLFTGDKLMLPFSDRGRLPGFVRYYHVPNGAWSHSAVRPLSGATFRFAPPQEAINPFAGDELYLSNGVSVHQTYVTHYSGGKLYIYSPVVGTFYVIR